MTKSLICFPWNTISCMLLFACKLSDYTGILWSIIDSESSLALPFIGNYYYIYHEYVIFFFPGKVVGMGERWWLYTCMIVSLVCDSSTVFWDYVVPSKMFKVSNILNESCLQAYSCYVEALHVQPTLPVAWSNLAGLFMETRDYKNALQCYKVLFCLCRKKS